MTCQFCIGLIQQGLDLSARARKIDNHVERALAPSRGRCATAAAAVLSNYDRDLIHWEQRCKAHLNSHLKTAREEWEKKVSVDEWVIPPAEKGTT